MITTTHALAVRVEHEGQTFAGFVMGTSPDASWLYVLAPGRGLVRLAATSVIWATNRTDVAIEA